MAPEQRRAWRREVFAEPGLTSAQKVVLLALETFADYRDGTNARPGVAMLAEMCRLRTRVVESALQRGRLLGFIEQTARANPKRGHAATYRIISTRADVRPESTSTRTSARVEDDFNPHESGFQPARNGVSTRTLVQPTYPLTPIHNIEEGLRQPGTSPDVPTDSPTSSQLEQSADGKQPRCARHAHIIDDADVPRCPDCRDARLADEARINDAAERERERRAAEYARIQGCPDCRGTRWLLDDNDQAVPCAHPKINAAGVA